MRVNGLTYQIHGYMVQNDRNMHKENKDVRGRQMRSPRATVSILLSVAYNKYFIILSAYGGLPYAYNELCTGDVALLLLELLHLHKTSTQEDSSGTIHFHWNFLSSKAKSISTLFCTYLLLFLVSHFLHENSINSWILDIPINSGEV